MLDDRAEGSVLDDLAAPDADARTADSLNSLVTFDGDTGDLAMPARYVLAKLLIGPSVDALRDLALWDALVANEVVIRARLHELFLELVLDVETGVAFTRQVRAEGVEFPVLLKRQPLTFADTVLVLHLRERLTRADVVGERAVVDREAMIEHLSLFKRSTTTDHAAFAKQTDGSIDKLKKLGLLQSIRGSDGRYEISPTLKMLFSADEIVAVTERYRAYLAPVDAVTTPSATVTSDPTFQ